MIVFTSCPQTNILPEKSKFRLFWFTCIPLQRSQTLGLSLQVVTHRTSSMSSLNSQESSNDISKLTDRQQAEYHNAYQDYISHMSQLEVSGSGTERIEDKAKDSEQEGRKTFKRNSNAGENVMDYSTTQDCGLLHPITEEEDEKPERKPSVSRTKGPGPRYHSVPNEEDEEECVPEETDVIPLLWEKQQNGVQAKSFVSAGIDKKESSDSGMRSSGSSSNHSLQDEESEEAQEEDEKSKEEDLVTTIRMSICSEAMSEASSPEENWATSHTQAVTNLNQAASSNSPISNNNNGDERSLIISPGSSTGTRALLNHNLLTVRMKSTNTTQDEGNEERESVL